MSRPPDRDGRRRAVAPSLVLVIACSLVVSLAAAGPAIGVGSAAGFATNPCVGTITDPPAGPTLVTIQGYRVGEKTDALLVAIAPNGRILGVHNDTAQGRVWTYDVDPLPDGDLLVATTEPGITVVEQIDPRFPGHVQVPRLSHVNDAHDVDRLASGEWLLVDKGDRRNRVLAYDPINGTTTWEWQFADHFPTDGGGPYGGDWTHVNDVDAIGDGRLLVSVRNFDQVIVVNRTTGRIDRRLGRDDAHEIMFEQHNPQFLRGANGTPTVLVANSRNDRVVEYARTDGAWTRTWTLVGGGLDDPRDADRLPSGNTLVVDRRGHRVLEVTPQGRVVWEFYVPWQPYDAERYRLGDEPGGPTTRELGATGRHELTGTAGFGTSAIEACSAALTRVGRRGGPLLPDRATDERPATGPATETVSEAADSSSAARTAETNRVPWAAVSAGAVAGLGATLLGAILRKRGRGR